MGHLDAWYLCATHHPACLAVLVHGRGDESPLRCLPGCFPPRSAIIIRPRIPPTATTACWRQKFALLAGHVGSRVEQTAANNRVLVFLLPNNLHRISNSIRPQSHSPLSTGSACLAAPYRIRNQIFDWREEQRKESPRARGPSQCMCPS